MKVSTRKFFEEKVLPAIRSEKYGHASIIVVVQREHFEERGGTISMYDRGLLTDQTAQILDVTPDMQFWPPVDIHGQDEKMDTFADLVQVGIETIELADHLESLIGGYGCGLYPYHNGQEV